MLGDISNTVPSLGQSAAGGVNADPQATPDPLTGGKWGGAMQPGMTPITGNPTPGQTPTTGPGQQPAIQYPVPQSNDSQGGFPPPASMPGGPQPTPMPGVGGKAGAPGFGQPTGQPGVYKGQLPPGFGQPNIQPVPLPGPGQIPDFARRIAMPGPGGGPNVPQMRPPAQGFPLQPVKGVMPQPGQGNGMGTVGMPPRGSFQGRPMGRGFGRQMGPNGQIIT